MNSNFFFDMLSSGIINNFQMSSNQLATRILQITNLDSIQFEHQLMLIIEAPSLLHFLAQIMTSDLPHNQKLMASTGVNLVVKELVRNNVISWYTLWKQFSEEVLLHREIDVMEWRYLQILDKSVRTFFRKMQADLPLQFMQIFQRTSYKVKLLLYSAFLDSKVAFSHNYLILRQTIEDLLRETLSFVCWRHDNNKEGFDYLQMEMSAIQIVEIVIKSLKYFQKQEQMSRIIIKLSTNEHFYQLLLEQLLFDFGQQNFMSIYKKQFHEDRIIEILLSSRCKQNRLRIHSNLIKAKMLKSFSILVSQYHQGSMVQEFDHYKHLNFLQRLMPLALEELTVMATFSERDDDQEAIAYHLLCLVNSSCRFNFLMKFFDGNFNRFFLEVCYPFLSINNEEKESFESDTKRFIQLTEELTQQTKDKQQSVLNATGEFLETLVQTLNGSANYVLEICSASMRWLLINKDDNELAEIRERFRMNFSVENSITVLTVLTTYYLRRQDIHKQLRYLLHELGSEFISLRGLPLAKLFLFLSYNYKTLYRQRQTEAADYLNLASNYLSQQSTIGECALLLFCNCVELGFGEKIWGLLLGTVENVGSLQSLQALRKIVRDKMDDLPYEYMKSLVQVVIARLIKQYNNCEEQSRNVVRGSEILTQCLNVIEEVSSNKSYLRANLSLFEDIWVVFDLFEFVDRIQFEDSILKIFNNLCRAQRQLSKPYYSFLDKFPLIMFKYQTFSKQLLAAYALLFSKGKQHFLANRCIQDLVATILSMKLSYQKYQREQNLKYMCIFMHYSYLKYNQLIKRDDNLINNIIGIYQTHRMNVESNNQSNCLEDQTVAAIINLLLIDQVIFGQSHRSFILENPVMIFREYQAQIAALNFHMIIEKYYREEWIIDYLLSAIRLLHFIREIDAQPNHDFKSYFRPTFLKQDQTDPFAQVMNTLNFLKGSIERSRYDDIIMRLQDEVNFGIIKDLLTMRVVQSKMRKVLKVRDVKRQIY